jgi:glycosyltransferase involved in cell wall biosynthesis
MSTALARAGVSVTIASTDADGTFGRVNASDAAYASADGVRLHLFRRTIPGEWKLSVSLAWWLFANVRDFDVVHVHSLFNFATIPACRAARRARVPYVVRPLGQLDGWSLKQGSWKKAPYLHLVERSHLANASAIHATSESEAESVRALGYGDKVRVIPLGVPAAQPRVAAASAGAPVRLLFLSRLHPKKNIPLLLAALRIAVDRGARVRLTIAGAGTADYVASLRAMAAERQIEKEVQFAGHVEGEAKRRLFVDSDLFVLPSHQENFGIAAAEALAAGLPVIVSDQVAIAGDVAGADAGLVVPVDVEKLAGAIVTLANAPETRRRMGLNAAALARDRYSWEATAHALVALYEELRSRSTRVPV